jgi:hypothetical protein
VLPRLGSPCRPPVSAAAVSLSYSDAKVANRNGRGFGWKIAHAAVSRRPRISPEIVVSRTRMYTYDATVCDSSIVQGPVSVAPCQTIIVTIRCLFTAASPQDTRARSATRRGHHAGSLRRRCTGCNGRTWNAEEVDDAAAARVYGATLYAAYELPAARDTPLSSSHHPASSQRHPASF